MPSAHFKFEKSDYIITIFAHFIIYFYTFFTYNMSHAFSAGAKQQFELAPA